MSLGDAIRGALDPLDPAVRGWLQRELPRLVQDGIIGAMQADAIARRYGVRVEAPAPAAQPPVAAASEPVAANPSTPSTPTPAASPFVAGHAISIVLYLGAFLVVAAVVIFLAYSWGDISGGAKLATLALLTAGFLGAAGLCLPRPAVKPAGRTFLALGALMVPANVAAAYVVYFQDGPIPGAVFWLLGALLSGGFHALLSVRLASRAYGALAALAVPVATCALAWLVVPNKPWLGQSWVLGPSAAVGLLMVLAAARRAPPIPLVQSARVIGSLLLPIAFLVSLPFLEERDEGQYGAPIALLLMSGGLAWEALRGGRTWWIGAAASLLALLPLAIVLTEVADRGVFVAAVVASTAIPAFAARRLPPRQRAFWDIAAIVPAVVYPFAAWEEAWASVALFAGLTLVTGLVSWGWRSPLPLYAAVFAVDGAYVRLLDVYGNPDSPAWTLGVALWGLGVVWAVVGAALPRRWAGPCWLGALVTLLVAAFLVREQSSWCVGVAATGAVASVVAAWRLRVPAILLVAAPWLLVAGYVGADAARLDAEWRLVVAGATGWFLVAVSLLRETIQSAPVVGSDPVREETPTSPAPQREEAPTPNPPLRGANIGSADIPVREAGEQETAAARQRGVIGLDLVRAWALLARLSAVGVAGLMALMLLAGVGSGDDWRLANVAGWLDLALMLAAWALLARARDLAVAAALAVVPALYAGIWRLHPTEDQAYALTIGLYLLAVAAVTKRDRRPGRSLAASAIAAFGLLALLGTGVVQSFDRDRFGYALLTLAEGLVLVGVGIAIRWRVLVVGGVAGTVIIAMRQLFDAVAALPGWAILGGSGILLLGIAVALLLARARLTAAGRAAAERWSNWD